MILGFWHIARKKDSMVDTVYEEMVRNVLSIIATLEEHTVSAPPMVNSV